MKILIVEDEVLIREGMSDYLMECGYEVFEAGDGQEALDLFHREAPEDQLSPCPHADGLP